MCGHAYLSPTEPGPGRGGKPGEIGGGYQKLLERRGGAGQRGRMLQCPQKGCCVAHRAEASACCCAPGLFTVENIQDEGCPSPSLCLAHSSTGTCR